MAVMRWYQFFDMYSGGFRKEANGVILIEAENRTDAIETFYLTFGHNPLAVTCECCGPDYVIYPDVPPEQASSDAIVIHALAVR